ncbi:MAG TPA: tetratricopeptide repeat protein [Gemmatimonadaceae bacterium]|nr:tetratricopeptide repeat protein [Gemmatimonadaceae bacterium]
MFAAWQGALASWTCVLAAVLAGAISLGAPVVGAQTPGVRPVAQHGPVPVADSAIEQLDRLLQRYPDSPLRAGALFELGELLVRRADERFAVSERGDSAAAPSGAPTHPDYGPAIARYEELVKRYPNFDQIDGAAYTLGTLYAFDQRYAEAVPMFELVAAKDSSHLRAEAMFRLGDAEFELASAQRGDARLALYTKAAAAYEHAATVATAQSDVYFLSLYKLGWSYYNTATHQNPEGYTKAVDVFGTLVDAYDKLPPERQQRLGLRNEALEYMAVCFTQVGGASAANRYFADRPDSATLKIPVLRRVAARLRDQGDFAKAVDAYQELLVEAPDDSSALSISRDVIDIYQNRTLEPDKAQQARLALVQKFAPGYSWVNANPTLAKDATAARETALRESAQFELAKAQAGSPRTVAARPTKSGKGRASADVGLATAPVEPTSAAQRQHYAEAARLYGIYMADYGQSDSAQAVDIHYADALFGAGDYGHAGTEYTRAAFGLNIDTVAATAATKTAAQQSAQNAIVSWDSVATDNKTNRSAQDSLFAAVDRYAEHYPRSEIAKRALIEKGRRAAEAGRWDVEAATFRTYAVTYPSDPYTPTAQKQVGDALYKNGNYADAQAQWDTAAVVARQSGRRGLADSLKSIKEAAASAYADSLIKRGDYKRAADEVYVAFADKNPGSPKAPDALRDAIETYMLADSVARKKGDQDASKADRTAAAELANRLITQYPTYQYRLQYQTLYADLLMDIGQGDQSVAALRTLLAQNPTWKGRADAEIKLAVRLDSLGKGEDAAAAYEKFAADYAKDPRAADAKYNAAVSYVLARDTAQGARTYGEFATRFPQDRRAAQARVLRVTLLKASGDSSAAGSEIARLCSQATPPPEIKGDCARRAGQAAFDLGLAQFMKYRSLRLVIASRAQLTAAGVKRASAAKQKALAEVTSIFTKAIASGDPEYLSAGTYYVGLSQWEYGNFLKHVNLPSSLSDAERQAATAGAGQQAEAYYADAKKTWQALLDKATQQSLKNRWIDFARDGTQGTVPDVPPT